MEAIDIIFTSTVCSVLLYRYVRLSQKIGDIAYITIGLLLVPASWN